MKPTSPSACTVMRPDADGRLVLSPRPTTVATVGVRPGAVFGAWEGDTESWHHDDPVSLEQATAYVARVGGDAEVCFRAGDYCPKPLNAAERRQVRYWLEDGSE